MTNSQLIDEAGRRLYITGAIFPDANGATGLNPGRYIPGKVSQVTYKEEPGRYLLADGTEIPLIALALIDPATNTVKPYGAGAAVPLTRTISTTAPLSGGGALSGDLTLSIPPAANGANGYLSAADHTAFAAKEPAITPGTSLQYYRGDKTMQTLNTNAVVEALNLYYTSTRARNDTVVNSLAGNEMDHAPSVFAVNAALALAGSGRVTHAVSGPFTIPTLTSDYLLNVDSTGGPVGITLPSAIASNTWCVDVKNLGSNTVTDSAPLGQTVDNVSAKLLIKQFDSDRYCAVGGNWFVY